MRKINSPLCQTNEELSKKVKDFIDNVSDVGEESITDFLVWQWKEIDSRFNAIKVSKFTKHQENTLTGADFEMELWIINDSSATPLLFQAKKLPSEHHAYLNKLRYKNNSSSQLNTLMSYSKSQRKIPYYIFYSSDDNLNKKCSFPYSKFGAFVTPATNIQKLTNSPKGTKLSRSKILDTTTPFHCFFCCDCGHGNAPKRMPMFDRAFSKKEAIKQDLSGNYPKYIEMIINNEFNTSEMLLAIEEYKLYHSRYIAVYDIRDSDKSENPYKMNKPGLFSF